MEVNANDELIVRSGPAVHSCSDGSRVNQIWTMQAESSLVAVESTDVRGVSTLEPPAGCWIS